jgi:hypothetical protein
MIEYAPIIDAWETDNPLPPEARQYLAAWRKAREQDNQLDEIAAFTGFAQVLPEDQQQALCRSLDLLVYGDYPTA